MGPVQPRQSATDANMTGIHVINHQLRGKIVNTCKVCYTFIGMTDVISRKSSFGLFLSTWYSGEYFKNLGLLCCSRGKIVYVY